MLTAVLCLLFAGGPLSTPRWTVETTTHTIGHSTLGALDAKGTLHVRVDAEQLALPRVVELRRTDVTLPALLTRNCVCLTNGDRIPLDPDAPAVLEGSRLRVWPGKSLPALNAEGVSLYVPTVVMAFWAIPDGVENAERYLAEIEAEPRKRDVVFLQNGDRLEGTVTKLTGKDGCIVTVGARHIHTPWAKLAGIAWSTERQSRLRTKKTYWRATLDGGARINFLDATFDEKTRRWTGVTQFGATLDLPEAGVIALDRRQAAAIDLADLTPTRYEQRPYLDVAWPLVKNASVSGSPIRIRENTYEHGVGVHAPCRVEYKLDGQYQRFLVTVGIHDAARRGRAKVAIELDGKRINVNEGKELTNQTPPIPVHLDVTRARTLALIVEPGSFGDVQAHVDFAKARLIKKD
jgi:hypothetical protein